MAFMGPIKSFHWQFAGQVCRLPAMATQQSDIQPNTTPGEIHLFRFLAVTTLGKWLINTGKRIFYPFAPAMARGMGVDVSAITSLIALNQTTALLAPFVMSLADTKGYKPVALLAMLVTLIAFLAMGLFPVYGVVLVGIFLIGMTKSVIDPTFQAMVGEHVAPRHRGRAVGIMEISWAASTLISIPVCGFIISRYHWQTPFLVLAVLTLICLGILYKVLPENRAKQAETSRVRVKEWLILFKNPRIAALLIYSFCVCMANDNFFVTYGFWLEDTYALSLTSIGLGTILIGGAEILGELLMAFLSDRLGIVRTLRWSTLFSALSFLALLFLDGELGRALGGLFLIFFTFEFSYVTSMALTTELSTTNRGTLLSLFFAVRGLGRVVGALSGGICWSFSGITGVCAVSGLVTLVAFLVLIPGLRQAPAHA